MTDHNPIMGRSYSRLLYKVHLRRNHDWLHIQKYCLGTRRGGAGWWLWTIKWWSLWDAHAWQTFKILTLYHLQKLKYLAQWWPFKRSRCLSSMKLLHHSQSLNASSFLSCPPKYHPMDHNDSEDNFSDRRRSSDEYLKLKPWEYFYLREIFWNNFDCTREIHHTRHAAHWTVDTYM